MSGSHRSGVLAALLAGVFLAALVAAAGAGASVPAAADGPTAAVAGDSEAVPAAESALTQNVEADRVEFRVTVFENASAEWRFRYERQLESDSEREDFEAFAEEFNTAETDTYRNFQERASSLTASGANATGRGMNATAFQREAYTEERGIDASREFGVIEMSFRWDAFAAEEDGRLVVGDVFDGGLYVGEDQTVVFAPGAGLEFREVQPDDADLSAGTLADSDSVTWAGERSFTDNRPRVVFGEAGAAEPTTTAGSGPVTDNDPGWLIPLAALAAVVVAGLAAAVAYRSGALPQSSGDAGAVTTKESGAGGAEAAAVEPAETSATETVEGDAEAAAAGASVSEADLMSDDERVVSLLEANGGRMKQVKIVEETGWSKSKVSMLLSDMEEDGTISKLRVGRENIVSLSGHEPDAAGSPFDEE